MKEMELRSGLKKVWKNFLW